jgi:TetR/AcrR family transcriptional regulator, cholesterol catabolism regulator
MQTRREAKKLQVRARLMEAALALFRERGVDATTVQDVVDRADTAKGTFFNYFPTKDHVLVAYYDRLTDDALARALRSGPAPSAEARVIGLLRACAATLDDVVLTRALLRAVFSSAVVAAADDATERRLHAVLRPVLQDGMARGEFRPDLELDEFCALLTGVLSATIQDWALRGGRHDLETTVDARLRLLFRAAYPPAPAP